MIVKDLKTTLLQSNNYENTDIQTDTMQQKSQQTEFTYLPLSLSCYGDF